jgi:tetratricopeptide (TPR) repeat protein
LVKDGRVVLIGPRGIGKSTLATYVAWRSLLGGLGSVVLDKSMDAVIRVDSLNPGDAAKLNNLIKTAGRRIVVIYDPSPIETYYKPETMQRAKHEIESIKKTLRELMEVRNAWVVIILPSELYDEVSRSEELRSILDEIRSYIIDVDLRDGEFLREVIRKYSGCDDVSDDLVKGVMGFDSYTLVAKYAGIWLRERGCEVEDIDKALRESAGEPKLFFANYMWSTVLGGNEDLAKKVSIPLILHAVFGPIPEGITYITKAVNEGGVWRLIDRDSLAKSKLEDLREADLEPIAKWLSTWHEDLIEETLKDLVGLHGEEVRNNYRNHGFENFIKALDWGYEKALEEVRGLGRETKPEEVETNLLIFVSERLKHALKPYTNCWKRAALIIGYALSGRGLVPRPEDLPKDLLEDAKYLSDALGGCGIDDYLLVGNEIPLLIMGLVHARVLSEAFVDEYDGAVGEVDRVLEIVGNRGRIYGAEGLYGLGLASIIASVAGLGRIIKPSDADAALHIASIAIKDVLSSNLIISILHVLRPLRDYAPHRYLGLLSSASGIESLDSDTVRRILDELNEILDDYGDVVRGYAWSLVHAIDAYAVLLRKYFGHFNSEEVGDMVGRVVDLLNELGRFKSKLGVIAWAYALAPALEHEYVRGLMEEKLGIDVVGKASEVLEELNDMRERVQELMGDKEFMSYVESWSVKADEEAVKIKIIEAASLLKNALAHYRLINDELDEARNLFNEAAEERKEIGDYENELVNRSLALRVEAIKGSLVGDELVNGFRQLYEEAFNEEHFMPTARYLSIVSNMLGGYLVSLALTGNYEKINELLEKYRWVLNANKQASVLTRLVLNALLGSKDRKDQLGSELKDKLSVNPEELIDAFGYDVLRKYLPALRVAPGIAKPEDVGEMCMLINDSIKGERVVCGDYVIEWLRWGLVDDFRESLIEEFGQLKELGVNADKLLNMFDKFMELVVRLDGESLVQLNAPTISIARLALMLYALVNGDEGLAKAHALYGAVKAIGSKLLTKLFLEAYESCCDLGSEGFRRTIAKLFLLHV